MLGIQWWKLCGRLDKHPYTLNIRAYGQTMWWEPHVRSNEFPDMLNVVGGYGGGAAWEVEVVIAVLINKPVDMVVVDVPVSDVPVDMAVDAVPINKPVSMAVVDMAV